MLVRNRTYLFMFSYFSFDVFLQQMYLSPDADTACSLLFNLIISYIFILHGSQNELQTVLIKIFRKKGNR